MKTAYKVLAYLIALEVMVQAAAIAFAFFGLGKWIDDGGTLDKAALDSQDLEFTGVIGFMIHGLNGMMIIPAIALIFLIFSFFAKIPGGAKWAAFVLLSVVVQVSLGIFGHETPELAPLHGVNALILFSLAVMAGMRVSRVTATTDSPQERELV